MPIQGTNADMIKVAMTRIVKALRSENLDASLVNMVHDEVVLEAAAQDAERVRDVVSREMMSAGAEFVRSLPMTVDTVISETWAVK